MLVYHFYRCCPRYRRLDDQIISNLICGNFSIINSYRHPALMLFQKISKGLTIAQGLRALCQMLVNLYIVLRQIVHQLRGLVEVLIDTGLVAAQLFPGNIQFGFDFTGLFYRRREQPVSQCADHCTGDQ